MTLEWGMYVPTDVSSLLVSHGTLCRHTDSQVTMIQQSICLPNTQEERSGLKWTDSLYQSVESVRLLRSNTRVGHRMCSWFVALKCILFGYHRTVLRQV